MKKESQDGFIVVATIVRTKGWAGEICLTGHNFLLYTFEVGQTKIAWSRDQEGANVMLSLLLLIFSFASRELFCKRGRILS